MKREKIAVPVTVVIAVFAVVVLGLRLLAPGMSDGLRLVLGGVGAGLAVLITAWLIERSEGRQH